MSLFAEIAPAAQAKITILVDDEEIGRIWGYSLQQLGMDVSIQCITSENCVEIMAGLPDLLLIDDSQGSPRRIEFLRSCRSSSQIPILLMTTRNDENYLLEAYQAGADDCLPQPVSPRIFLAKVRAWLRHGSSAPAAPLGELHLDGFVLDPSRRTLLVDGRTSLRLTSLEVRLLSLLMHSPGRVFDPQTLIEHIWGIYGSGDGALLKNLVYRLRRKIEPDPGNPRHLLYEPGFGYKFSTH